jgi:hypothetical protein
MKKPLKVKAPSIKQKNARNRNWNKAQILGIISMLDRIILNGRVTKKEATQLNEARKFLYEVIINWEPTIK